MTLPRGLSREFSDEVEAELIRNPKLRDLMLVRDYFVWINPQKEEE